MHPIPPSARAECRGASLGEFDDAEFLATVRATEAGLEEVVQAGLFLPQAEVEFDWLERFDTAAELLEAVEEWEGCRTPGPLAQRIRAAEGPVDVWEHVVLRRFRAGG